MKKILTLILALLTLSCAKIELNQNSEGFLATRGNEPLVGTIWEHKTGEEFNRYLYFTEDEANLFYGYVEDGELQRHTIFYNGKYEFDGNKIKTCLYYPYNKNDIQLTVGYYIEGNSSTISFNDDIYEFYGTNAKEIEPFWMTIFVTIVPWN